MKTKRILSFLLCAILIVGMLPLSVSAEEETSPPATITYQGDTYALLNSWVDEYQNGGDYIFVGQAQLTDYTGYCAMATDFSGVKLEAAGDTYVPAAGEIAVLSSDNSLSFGHRFTCDGKYLDLTGTAGSMKLTWADTDDGVWVSEHQDNTYAHTVNIDAKVHGGLAFDLRGDLKFTFHNVSTPGRERYRPSAYYGEYIYTYQKVCDHTSKTSHAAVDATCTTGGNAAYSVCDTCGSYLDTDGSRTNISSDGYTRLNSENTFKTYPLGHHYIDGVCTHDSSHKAPEYTLVTSADMLSEDAKYRYIIVNEDNKVFGIDHRSSYCEMAMTNATVDSNGTLTLDNSSDADGVYGAEFALSVFTPSEEEKDANWPTDGTPLYTLFTDSNYGLLAMGALWLDYSPDGNAKYPISISPADDGITAIRSWNYGDWGEPVVYSEDEKSKTEGFTLGETANVKLYRGEVVEATPSHEHIWSEDWSSNGTAHWHECTAAGCDITENTGKDGYGAHTFGAWTENSDGEAPHRECTVCGYKETATPVRLYAVTDCDGKSVGDIKLTPSETNYYVGDEITLTAPAVPGYSFNGWYQDDQNDQVVCSSLIYTFTIEDHTKLIASYTASGNAIVTISVVNGAQYTVGDSDTVKSGSTENIPVGSTLTLTAVDADKVLQWQNESSKVLGRGASLTITVTGDMSITLAYKTETAGQSYVQFVSDYGQVLSAKMYSVTDAIIFPDSPTKFGYTFTGWVFDNTTDEATAETIKAKLGTEPTITVKPRYTKDETYGSVTVNYMTRIAGNVEMTTITDETVINNISTGTAQVLTAKDIDGYTFECWKNADGTVLGYDRRYTIMITGDKTLIAYYVADGGEIETAKPVIVIDELYTVTSGSAHKVSGKVNRTIPNGYTLIEHGVLYARNVADLNETTFVYGTEGVGKYISNDASINGVVTLNVKVASDDVVVSLRGYMLLVNNITGNQEYFYTDIRSGSYHSINND